MKKVKLTQKQYDGVDKIAKLFEGFQLDRLKKVIEIIERGYEVDPEYKVGDWVVHKDKGEIGKVVEVSDLNTSIEYYSDSHSKFRYATESEIKEEKQRRWWNAHGRDVWELKEGDILRKSQDNELLTVTDLTYYKGMYVKNCEICEIWDITF